MVVSHTHGSNLGYTSINSHLIDQTTDLRVNSKASRTYLLKAIFLNLAPRFIRLEVVNRPGDQDHP